MTSQKFIKFLITLVALSLLVAIPAMAQGPGEEVGGSVDEAGAGATDTPADSEQAAPVESAGGTVDEGAQNSDSTAPVAAPEEQAGGAVEEFDSVGNLGGLDSAVAAAEDVNPAGTMPGSYTADIIAVANLNTTGSAGAPDLSLSPIGGGTASSISGISVFPGGVSFLDSSKISQGEYSGILSSDFTAAVAVLISNPTAHVADMYKGFNESAIATEVYATLIFNKHSNTESTFYCQNAGSTAADIKIDLYVDGVSTVKASKTFATVAAGTGIKWDIADDTTLQTTWPGGAKQFGYAKFTSANKIACVTSNERMIAPYLQTFHNAVPTTGYASKDLRIPLIYNGHGSSAVNTVDTKFISGISIVNPNAAEANVTVKYTSITGYTNNCTAKIAANGSTTWHARNAGTAALPAFTCPSGQLTWPNVTGSTYSVGSVVVESDQPVLALANSNKYDKNNTTLGATGLGAGYSSQGVAPTAATTKIVCPLVLKSGDGNADWATGIQVANVGSSDTNVSFKLVKADSDPATAANVATKSLTAIKAGSSGNITLGTDGVVTAGWKGVVFIESSTTNAIVASASSTSYNKAGDAALYDCINY